MPKLERKQRVVVGGVVSVDGIKNFWRGFRDRCNERLCLGLVLKFPQSVEKDPVLQKFLTEWALSQEEQVIGRLFSHQEKLIGDNPVPCARNSNHCLS